MEEGLLSDAWEETQDTTSFTEKTAGLAHLRWFWGKHYRAHTSSEGGLFPDWPRKDLFKGDLEWAGRRREGNITENEAPNHRQSKRETESCRAQMPVGSWECWLTAAETQCFWTWKGNPTWHAERSARECENLCVSAGPGGLGEGRCCSLCGCWCEHVCVNFCLYVCLCVQERDDKCKWHWNDVRGSSSLWGSMHEQGDGSWKRGEFDEADAVLVITSVLHLRTHSLDLSMI